jgi:hypothetical protein
MNKRLTTLVVLLLLAVATAPPSAEAAPYDMALCPMVAGQFLMREGALWLTIVKQGGKPVAKRTEKIANPLDDRSHEVLAKRGNVKVEVHQDKNGGLFVHWGTLADDKE